MQPTMQIVLPVFMARNLTSTGDEIKDNAVGGPEAWLIMRRHG